MDSPPDENVSNIYRCAPENPAKRFQRDCRYDMYVLSARLRDASPLNRSSTPA